MPAGTRCTSDQACKSSCATFAIHAEQDVLLQAGREADGSEMLHLKTVDGAIVRSGPPSCVQCSKLMLQAGVVAVWLCHEGGWRRYSVAEFHRASAIANGISEGCLA